MNIKLSVLYLGGYRRHPGVPGQPLRGGGGLAAAAAGQDPAQHQDHRLPRHRQHQPQHLRVRARLHPPQVITNIITTL